MFVYTEESLFSFLLLIYKCLILAIFILGSDKEYWGYFEIAAMHIILLKFIKWHDSLIHIHIFVLHFTWLIYRINEILIGQRNFFLPRKINIIIPWNDFNIIVPLMYFKSIYFLFDPRIFFSHHHINSEKTENNCEINGKTV